MSPRLLAYGALVAFLVLVLVLSSRLLSIGTLALIIAGAASVGVAIALDTRESDRSQVRNVLLGALILLNLAGIGVGGATAETDIRLMRDKIDAQSSKVDALKVVVQTTLDWLKNHPQLSSEDVGKLLQQALVRADVGSSVPEGSKPTATPAVLVCPPTGAFSVLRTVLDHESAQLGGTIYITVTVCNDSGRPLALGADPQVHKPDDSFFTSPGGLAGYRSVLVQPGAVQALPPVPLTLDQRGQYVIYGAAFSDTDRSSLAYWFNTAWRSPVNLVVQ